MFIRFPITSKLKAYYFKIYHKNPPLPTKNVTVEEDVALNFK